MLILALVRLLSPAQAACTLSALSPATGATLTPGMTFTFLSTTDCATTSLAVNGVAGTRSPRFVRMVGDKQKMQVIPSAADWAAYAALARDTLIWRVTATDAAGASITRAATNELDIDADSWTRTGGDCDDGDPTAFPGNPEIADGADNNCNGLVDDGVAASGPLTGVDLSAFDSSINWRTVAAQPVSFVLARATEGDYYTSANFLPQFDGAAHAGLIRGATHFAIPDGASGATQAAYFVEHGGAWSADGQTLPGTVILIYNPYGATCYGMSAAELTAWIQEFSDTYQTATGRAPILYTVQSWWDSCVAASTFGSTNPLWIASYGVEEPPLPSGWSAYTFWQYTESGSVPGISGSVDMDLFPGDSAALSAFADGI